MKSRVLARRKRLEIALLCAVCVVLIIILNSSPHTFARRERRRTKTDPRSPHPTVQPQKVGETGAKYRGPDRWTRYRPPVQSGVRVVGKRFEFGDHIPQWIGNDYVIMTSHSARDFVIATAASLGFYAYALSAVETVQRHLPNRRIIVYDLESETKPAVAEMFNSVCGVNYRQFNFSQYPEHIKTLWNYAWKPLVITELLSEYPGVFWIDSSIRLTSGDLDGIFDRAIGSDGMLALTSTGHSNYAVTHSQTYDYLPTSLDQMVAVDQHEANCLLLYRTRRAVENVLWWWRLCALDVRCIAPTMLRSCAVSPYASRGTWAQCHRFDQSALNILLANWFAFDAMKYFGSHRVTEVLRGSVSRRNLSICASRLPSKAVTVSGIMGYFLRAIEVD